MNNSKSKILPILLLFAATISCAKKKPAAIVLKGDNVYSRASSYNKNKYQKYESPLKESKKNKEEVVERNLEAPKKRSESSKVQPTEISDSQSIVIAPGNTVYSIARDHNVPIRDLISENNLTPPYSLKAGNKIVIPSAKYHEVVAGDTLYSISRKYGMNVNNLIELNNLSAPYNVKLGDKLRISKKATTVAAAPAAPVSSHDIPETKSEKSATSEILEKKSEEKIIDKNNKFIWPTKGQIVSKFGPKTGGLYNDGINIKGKSGDPVKATEDGVVAYVGNELRGYGNLIIVKHSGGWISAYAHLDKTKVARGDKVKQGEVIGAVGSTGNVDFPQLYFGIRKGREAVNPEVYLAGGATSNSPAKKIIKMHLKSGE